LIYIKAGYCEVVIIGFKSPRLLQVNGVIMDMPQSSLAAPTTDPHVHIAEARCPVCNQPIPNEDAHQVHARMSVILEEQFAKLLEQAQRAAQQQIDALSQEKPALQIAHKTEEPVFWPELRNLSDSLKIRLPEMSSTTPRTEDLEKSLYVQA
jgi:DNA repair exonuclease SbcCD ATPase subunit